MDASSKARSHPRFEVSDHVLASQGMVDLGFEPRQRPPCIVPHGRFVHDADHPSFVHPVLLHADALQLPMCVDIVTLQQGSGIFRPQVPAAQGEIGGCFTGSGLLNDLCDVTVLHGDHAKGRGFLRSDAHQTGHRSPRPLVRLHQVA